MPLDSIIQNNELHHAAADKSKFESVCYLLDELGLDVNLQHTQNNMTVAEYTAQYGSIETLSYLLDIKQANIDASTKSYNLFDCALQNPDPTVAQFIADSTSAWISQFNDGTTQLHAAVLLDNLEAVKQIASVNPMSIADENIRGQSALFFAAANEYSAICHYLLEMAMQNNLPQSPLFQQLNHGQACNHIKHATSFEETDDLANAFKHYHQAQKCLTLIQHRTADQQKQLFLLYQAMATNRYKIKNYQAALELINKALVLIDSQNSPYLESIHISLQQINQAIRMQAQGFEIYDVPRDHKCFFHTINQQLKLFDLPVFKPDAIRTKALEHISQHWQYYQLSTVLTKEQYIKYYSNPHAWPDDLLILATARRFRLTLVIIVELEQSTQSNYTVIFKQPDARGTMYLLNENNSHFKLLLPNSPLPSAALQAEIDAKAYDEDVIKFPELVKSTHAISVEQTSHPSSTGSGFQYVRQKRNSLNKMPEVSTASILPSLSLLANKESPRFFLPQNDTHMMPDITKP